MKSVGRVAPEIGVAMAFGTRQKRWLAVAIAAVIVVLIVSLTAPGQNLWQRFFSSLRIEKPKAVSVTIPGFSGSASSGRLQSAVGGMLADTTDVTLEEKDEVAPTQAVASQLAGFVVLLPQKRTDPATLIVTGARSVTMRVDRSQLQTIYSEAGDASVEFPASLNGTRVVLKTPRGVRAEYGHCAVADANSPREEVQGPPPRSTDNGDCIVLTQSPPTSADVPAGLDMQQLVGIGLELAGMSPIQRQAFQKIFSWQSALSIPLPRFMRSYDTVTVNGTPGMLLNTAGWRGRTYELLWTSNNIVYSLTGYGSSADAVPLANSLAGPRKQP